MNLKHGHASTDDRTRQNPYWKAHYTWLSMKARCNDTHRRDYPNYGGRGITFGPEWDDFSRFVRDVGLPPSPDHSLDRVDNDGSYCKENCRWATRTEQNRNRSNSRYLELNGERMTVPEWAERLGVKPRLLRVRLNRGWSVEDTLSRPSDATAGQFK